jgi:hypothetical protein
MNMKLIHNYVFMYMQNNNFYKYFLKHPIWQQYTICH